MGAWWKRRQSANSDGVLVRERRAKVYVIDPLGGRQTGYADVTVTATSTIKGDPIRLLTVSMPEVALHESVPAHRVIDWEMPDSKRLVLRYRTQMAFGEVEQALGIEVQAVNRFVAALELS